MQNDLRRAGRWALRSRGCVRGRLRRPGDAPLDGKRAPRRGCMAIEGGGTHSGVKRRVSSSMSNDSRNATAASICFDSVTVAMSSVGIRRNYSFSATVFSCNFVSKRITGGMGIWRQEFPQATAVLRRDQGDSGIYRATPPYSSPAAIREANSTRSMTPSRLPSLISTT
jgi:hypothetical protein